MSESPSQPHLQTWWDKLVVSLELADFNDPATRAKLDSAAAKANNQGVHLAASWQYARALSMLTAAVEIWTQLGHINGAVMARNARGAVYRKIGDYASALDDHNAALTLAGTTEFVPAIIAARTGCAAAYVELDVLDQAESLLDGVLTLSANTDDQAGTARAQRWLGRLHEARKDWNAALGAHGTAVEGWRALVAPAEEIEATTSVARVMLAQGGAVTAFTLIEGVLQHLGEHGPARLDDPLRVYWTITRTLKMLNYTETAHEMLGAAYTLLIRQMEGLSPAQRTQCRAVALHTEIAEAWSAAQADADDVANDAENDDPDAEG
ncbi:MAG: tetratricopeptide repeat protein [Anaerolineae bacterium]|nr:tetratricopeptide repeat protein [Anaerolineae bacterium]